MATLAVGESRRRGHTGHPDLEVTEEGLTGLVGHFLPQAVPRGTKDTEVTRFPPAAASSPSWPLPRSDRVGTPPQNRAFWDNSAVPHATGPGQGARSVLRLEAGGLEAMVDVGLRLAPAWSVVGLRDPLPAPAGSLDLEHHSAPVPSSPSLLLDGQDRAAFYLTAAPSGPGRPSPVTARGAPNSRSRCGWCPSWGSRFVPPDGSRGSGRQQGKGCFFFRWTTLTPHDPGKRFPSSGWAPAPSPPPHPGTCDLRLGLDPAHLLPTSPDTAETSLLLTTGGLSKGRLPWLCRFASAGNPWWLQMRVWDKDCAPGTGRGRGAWGQAWGRTCNVHKFPMGARLPKRLVLTSPEAAWTLSSWVLRGSHHRHAALNPALPEVRAGTSDQGLCGCPLAPALRGSPHLTRCT